MKEQLLKHIPIHSRTLGMLHDKTFRPSIAPHAIPIDDGRILFEQSGLYGLPIEYAAVVRAPICLLPEGDTVMLRTMSPSEAEETIRFLTTTLPTAAMLLDSHARLESASVVWFCEDQLYAKSNARTTGVDQDILLPLFKEQGKRTLQLLSELVFPAQAQMLPFSDKIVMDAIRDTIREEAQSLGFTSQQRKSLVQANAAIVASTHALFPDIVNKLISVIPSGVQGPVHLETNPPQWKQNADMARIVRFIDMATHEHPGPHRSLLPCLIRGEPIGEASALDEQGPQIRQDQHWKLEAWTHQSPFPLRDNPIFGHAIGLLDDNDIMTHIFDIIKSENIHDINRGILLQRDLADRIEQKLSAIGFWK